MSKKFLILAVIVAALGLYGMMRFFAPSPPESRVPIVSPSDSFILNHRGVTATTFYIGEPADDSNAHIPNHESAWTGDWIGAYGGIDDPEKRNGFLPAGFTPKENPFYIALPFNDKQENGTAKSKEVLQRIPWFTGSTSDHVSLMKNRWVEIRRGNKTAYGQIEDVGPMHEDDIEYVFGSASPKYSAGVDLSPALNDYLGVDGMASVDWRFVEDKQVPDGPWKHVVTSSQINY